VVTHNMDLARQMPRKIRMADGKLIGDSIEPATDTDGAHV
jgi:ABC-type lipoprotein export system ATPase subunit